MSRQERIALCLERIGAELPDLSSRIDVARVRGGEPEELLVAAARIEVALRNPSAQAEAELALLFLASGDYGRARRHADESVAGRGTPEIEARGHALLGRLAEVAHDASAAVHHYRLAAQLNPSSWRHQLDLAATLVAGEDASAWSEAAEAVTVASSLAGETDAIAFARAQVQLRFGETEPARRTLESLVTEGQDPYAIMAARALDALDRTT